MRSWRVYQQPVEFNESSRIFCYKMLKGVNKAFPIFILSFGSITGLQPPPPLLFLQKMFFRSRRNKRKEIEEKNSAMNPFIA